jgi:nucleotide-binding universal stress UspA family protein
MKSILLYANQDAQFASRLSAALDAARLFEARLTCVQVTPFDAFIMGDPFGGIYALPSVVEHVARAEREHREQVEERLRQEGIAWSWERFDGAPEQVLARRAGLADLLVLSLPDADQADHERTLDMIGSVATAVRSLVLGVPAGAAGFRPGEPAMIAWNGSPEAAHALRLAVPLLRNSSRVDLVAISDRPAEKTSAEASDYLGCYGISAAAHELQREKRPISEQLLDRAAGLGDGYVVLGAYGHSRLRETVLGGTTRAMLCKSPLPLLIAH